MPKRREDLYLVDIWAVAREQVPELEPQIRAILLQEYPDGIEPEGEPGA
jgi:hypothetical protein